MQISELPGGLFPATRVVSYTEDRRKMTFFLKDMAILQLGSSGLASLSIHTSACGFSHGRKSLINSQLKIKPSNKPIRGFHRRGTIRAVSSTVPERDSGGGGDVAAEDEPPSVGFAFVHSVLLPDGTPDVHFRTARGGQKLRDIMLDSNIELYGPYARPLLNCAGGGTCGTCMVEVVDGKELLSPRTDKERERLKRKPKNWRLACQATVGNPDSRGLVVIQQLPEWKAHEWKLEKELPTSDQSS